MNDVIERLMSPLAESELDTVITQIPLQLVEDLEEEGRFDLTFTRDHVAVLDAYRDYVMTIPIRIDEFTQWLGYYHHYPNPEISGGSIRFVLRNIMVHADSWTFLKRKSTYLPTALINCAYSFRVSGERALAACERTKALGGSREAWHGVQFEAPVRLNAQDRTLVLEMEKWVRNIKNSAGVFQFQVNEVRKETEGFRDKARFELRPALGEKLESVAAAGTKPGNLEVVAQQMRGLILRLEDVTTAVSHLQTVWQFIETYLDASIGKLHSMQDSQQLARFVIHFKNFLAQWSFIEECARRLQKRLE
ncbi:MULTISPECIES: hypothetical protein [Pseudomonas]|uniref:hypothetical protein n=1 Tax=Pseudomonas TaxID=286 RepID=UPI00257C60DF|nr:MULTISPECIES: hypothetical protein [Pseudomonas]